LAALVPVKGALDSPEAGPVVQLDKDQVFEFPFGSDPAPDFEFP
jgi:hypothetical protein